MPRGFLVKRSKRGSAGSYRIRGERDPAKSPGTGQLLRQPSPAPAGGVISTISSIHSVHSESEIYKSRSAEQLRQCVSPAFPRCLSSPAAAQSLPVSSIERLLLTSRADMKLGALSSLETLKRSCVEVKGKPAARKRKVARALSCEDEVTTSPVLGLRITKELPLLPPGRARPLPLGQFICQLCKEEYPDPFSLAQHRCSRIVRVEYRCPECDKVFSCPANLASHRRWHKPRDAPGAKRAPPHEKASLEGKENANDVTHHAHPQHLQLGLFPADAPQLCAPPLHARCYATLRPSSGGDEGPAEEEEEEECVYACHHCGKKFRRHAYLRKHLGAHQSASAHVESAALSALQLSVCHMCGARCPSAEAREKHRLWHALTGPPKTSSALLRADFIMTPKASRLWDVPT